MLAIFLLSEMVKFGQVLEIIVWMVSPDKKSGITLHLSSKFEGMSVDLLAEDKKTLQPLFDQGVENIAKTILKDIAHQNIKQGEDGNLEITVDNAKDLFPEHLTTQLEEADSNSFIVELSQSLSK